MASQVPYNPSPEVSPQLAPTPFGRNTPPPGAFGGLTALATEHFGAVEGQVGNELFERANAMQLMNQTAAADEGASHFQMKSSVLYNELLNRQGKDASDNLEPTLNRIEDLRQGVRASLDSPYAQMQYDRDTRRMQGMLMISAGRHAAEQQKAYSSGALQAKSDAAKNLALSLPQDDANFNAALADVDKTAQDMADLHGWDPARRDNWASQQKSDLTLQRISGVARTGDPFVAGRMIDQAIANKTLIGQDIAKATTDVFYRQNTAGAKQLASRILSGEGSMAGASPLPIDRAALAVGQAMSQDNYDLIGRADDGSGQALGRYRVPTESLSKWLKEADMPDMSPGDFIKSHKAQDQLFSRRFGDLQDETGSFNDALLKWIGREPSKLTGSGTNEQRQAFGFFKTKGWSDDAAHAMVATLSGESGVHLSPEANQKAGGRNWESRFEVSDPSNGIANWDNERSSTLEGWAKSQGLNPNDRLTQLKFVDYEARQMGINPSERGDPRALTIKYTGNTASGQGYEKPLINNGGDRWARYSGQRYINDPVIQQANGLIAHNTLLEDLLDQSKRMASDAAPNNPLLGEYLADRVTSLKRRQEAQREAEERQNKWIVDQALIPDEHGHVPTSLEELLRKPEVAAAYDHSPAHQLGWNKALTSNLVKGGVEFTDSTFRQYLQLHTASPDVNPAATSQERQALLDADIPSLDIPVKAKQILWADQQAVYKGEEASPQMEKAMKLLSFTFPDSFPSKADTDHSRLLQSELHDALAQHNRDFAKPATDDDIREIGRQLLLKQPQSWPEWIRAGFSSTDRQKYPPYQLPVPTPYVEKVKADPRWNKSGIEPTDEMIRTMWVSQQFQQLYAKQQATR